MNMKFILPALVMGITCILVAYISTRYRKKYGVVYSAVNTSVMLLVAIEWFYAAIFFMVEPSESFPTTASAKNLMAWLVFPFLTQIPLFFLVLFNVVYFNLTGKKRTEKGDLSS